MRVNKEGCNVEAKEKEEKRVGKVVKIIAIAVILIVSLVIILSDTTPNNLTRDYTHSRNVSDLIQAEG